MSTAEFHINASPFSDGKYEAVLGEALGLRLSNVGTDIRKVEFSVVSKARGDAALAGLPAQPPSPGDSVATTAPALGPGTYVLRCQLNDGGLSGADGKIKPIADWTKERLLIVRARTGKRKIATGESTHQSSDGWAGELSDDVVEFDRLEPNFNKQMAWVRPRNGTTIGEDGFVMTSAGTVSHPAVATSSLKESMRRTRWTSATSADAVGGIFTAHDTPAWRGNALGVGGFTFHARFSANTNVNGGRFFVGLSPRTSSIVAVDPSTSDNSIGMGWDAGDSSGGNWQLIRRDGTTTAKVDLGASAPRNTTDVYDLFLHCKPNDALLYVRIRKLSAAGWTTVLDTTYATTIPVATVLMRVHAAAGAAATGAAAEIDLMSAYLETR